MRLVTWNVFHGRSPRDGVVDPARFARAVARLDADVLALQEVDRGQPRSGGIDLTALAEGAMGATSSRFVPSVIGDPAAEWRAADDADLDAQADAYGVALVTRYPVKAWHLLRLAGAPVVRMPVPVPGMAQVLWLRDEPRAVVAATLDTPSGDLTVASTHLSFVPGVNGWQLRRAMTWLRTLPGPRILMGDLNIPAALVPSITGGQLLATHPTYPLPQPRVQVDHLVGDGELPPVVNAFTTRPPLSDHAALVVDLAEPG